MKKDTAESRTERDPLPYAATLERFYCFCGHAHTASPDIIKCVCGRRWLRRELPTNSSPEFYI